MNKRQKEVIQKELEEEQVIIDDLKKTYEEAKKTIEEKVQMLMADELTQSKIYQLEYQKALKTQISAILNDMNANNYESIHEYLKKCYEDAFIGTMYDLQGQGIPLIIPIDQELVVKAIQLDSKISGSLYESMGVDVKQLKKTISSEISRSISTGMAYRDTARNINNAMGIGLNKSIRIARTEGHRVNQQSTMDAMKKAKDKGADVVKQWDSTLDKKTRPHHQKLDGQIREIDEPFEVDGRKAMQPGGFGVAAEDINCRCVVLQRAKWALDEDELKTLEERAKYFGLDKMDNLEEYKSKYISASANIASQATTNSVYSNIIQSGGKIQSVGGVDCAVEEKDYGFTDGTAGGIKKTVSATIYTTPDGTKFVYPKRYDKSKQTLSPDDAIATWYRVQENVRTKIQKTVEVVDYYNPQDSYWKKTYKNFTHSYAIGGDKITIFRSNYHDLDYLVHTYCHEGGHYIDYNLPGTSKTSRYSTQQAWQDAMAKDLQTSGKKSWRSYGENSSLEDFADSVGYYTVNHDNFVATFPERSKLLDIILK